MNPPPVCLITPGHLASTPRLVKNADALVEAGYAVRVVSGRHHPPSDPLDAAILSTARWEHVSVDLLGGGALLPKLWGRVARRLVLRPGRSNRIALAARAHQAQTFRLAAAAARRPARLYLGHCLAGLPAAAFAARAVRARYGFDAEDFHDAETAEAAADPAERRARWILQAGLLPGCSHFTAASPLIAEKYAEAYGARPLSLLNVFPLAQAPAAPADPGAVSPDRPARLYWFSQTVGPGRGLEAMAAVLGRMRTPAELHLRGFVAPDYAADLERRAGRSGRIRFLPPGAPAEMARLAAGADLGLSVETSEPLNRDLCLTNKIFIYLLAGIPQLLSATAAQRALAPELGAAAMLADPGRPDETAARLDAFFASPAAVAAARRAAWDLARRRFCWDLEREKLLASVRRALA